MAPAAGSRIESGRDMTCHSSGNGAVLGTAAAATPRTDGRWSTQGVLTKAGVSLLPEPAPSVRLGGAPSSDDGYPLPGDKHNAGRMY